MEKDKCTPSITKINVSLPPSLQPFLTSSVSDSIQPPPVTYQHTDSAHQSPDSGIVVGNGTSFSSTDSSLSPCGTNTDAPTSSQDAHTARRRSKSLPELESTADKDGSETQERPASAEGVVKESQKDSTNKQNGGMNGVKSTSQQAGSRSRLNSNPDVRGTVPLSHAPSSMPSLKCSVSSTTPFAIPRVPYGSMHNHSGAYSTMHSGFPGYQSYGMVATGMPTQSAYPPTYNPYSGSTGSATAYVGNSGTTGSTLYHHNARFPHSSYSANPNMINYMSYPNSDCRQASAMSYSSPYNIPLSTHTTSAAAMYSTGSVSLGSSGGQDLGHIPVSSTAASSNSPSEMTLSGLGPTTIADTVHANNANTELGVLKSASLSPNGSSGSPAMAETDCDSTTHLNTMAPPAAEQETERESAKEDKTAEDGTVLRYYSTRYVSLQHNITHVEFCS